VVNKLQIFDSSSLLLSFFCIRSCIPFFVPDVYNNVMEKFNESFSNRQPGYQGQQNRTLGFPGSMEQDLF